MEKNFFTATKWGKCSLRKLQRFGALELKILTVHLWIFVWNKTKAAAGDVRTIDN
jgi:hypothetical protein